MKTRNLFWGVVYCGIMGALLSVGTAGAQPYPGGLPKCQADLATCTTNLGTCNTSLTQTQASLNTCNTTLGTCNTNFTQVQGNRLPAPPTWGPVRRT